MVRKFQEDANVSLERLSNEARRRGAANTADRAPLSFIANLATQRYCCRNFRTWIMWIWTVATRTAENQGMKKLVKEDGEISEQVGGEKRWQDVN